MIKPSRSKFVVEDPRRLRLNAYRVLLTRGRDGFVIFVPSVSHLDETEVALLAAGVRPLDSLDMVGQVPLPDGAGASPEQ
jgi:hypothetical protein